MSLLLAVHLFCTIAMTGIIWFVQFVHYPLFASVGRAGFVDYEVRHQRLTGFIVGPLMIGELSTAIWLIMAPPSESAIGKLWIGLLCVVAIWIITFTVHVPHHRQLSTGYRVDVHLKLVRTNWVRTMLWSVRSIIVLWVMIEALR